MKKSYCWTAVIALMFLIAGCESKEQRLQGFLLKGNLAMEQDQADQALYYFDQALKIDPCYVEALNNSGTIQHRSNHYEKAIEFYTKAVECKPDYLSALFNRANSYYESGEYFSAIADIERIEKMKPDTAVVYFLKGLVQSRQHQYEAALKSFQEAIDHKATNVIDCRVNRASMNFYLKRFAEAKSELIDCSRINPKESNIFNSLALIALEENKLDSALTYVNKAIELNGKQPYFRNNRGYIFLLMGQLDMAATEIDASISQDPYNAWAYRNKGLLLFKNNDLQSAERLLLKSLEMDPELDKAHFYLGQVYLALGNKASACSQFRESEKKGEGLVTQKELSACR